MKNKGIIMLVSAVLIIITVFSAASCGSIESYESDINGITENKKCEMPSVLGITVTDAVQILEDTGFSNITYNIPEGDGEIWFVTNQSVEAGKKITSETEIILSCNKKCILTVNFSSEYNLLFNKYDIEIVFDGQEIGTIPNGEKLECEYTVFNGEHKIVFKKQGAVPLLLRK